MSQNTHPIYIGTILLEPNRWRPGRVPSIRVSDWLGRFKDAGLDGMELWENHAAMADAHEVAAIAGADMPVTIYNSYIQLAESTTEERQRLAEMLQVTGAQGLKFNFTRDASRAEADIAAVSAWRDTLPEDLHVMCECHPGTIVEEPAAAARVFDRLGRDRFEVLVHPFTQADRLEEWFGALGPMITHAHCQVRDTSGRPVRMDRQASLVCGALDTMRAAGFSGSFTLEFTEGTGLPEETPALLWENALVDLAFLRENLR